MPKRVIDGEALWTSDRLLLLPVKYRAEFANLVPLASATGTFEADAQKVWRNVYSYNRPDVSPEICAEILDSLESARMLFRWTDETGKLWGYWVGIDKPGRLPARSQLERRNVMCGPEPPVERLNAFLERTSGSPEITESECQANDQSITSEPLVNDLSLTSGPHVNDLSLTSGPHVNDKLGSGSGIGSGIGSGSAVRTGNKPPDAPTPQCCAFEGQRLRITERQDEALATAFPWVDRPQEYAKIDSWLVAHPERTTKKYAAFAHNWFARVDKPKPDFLYAKPKKELHFGLPVLSEEGKAMYDRYRNQP